MCPSRREAEAAEGGVWQRESARCAVVLHEVFRWLSARDVCAASGACAAWRRAAAAPALWRRLLQRDALLSPTELRVLALHNVCWREEYVTTFAGWERGRAVRCGGSAAHAALEPRARSPSRRLLALLTDDDVALTIWRYSTTSEREWRVVWRYGLRDGGWSGVGRVQWAGSRLLLAGPLALALDWELLVIQLDDETGEGRVLSRARCGAGAAGCWADAAGEAFLSLELAVFAPGVACTTVWLNSASQETQSEHAGVRAPLFRAYNHSGEHFTQALVMESPSPAPAHDPHSTLDDLPDTSMDLDLYLTAIEQEHDDGGGEREVKTRVLVMTSGCRRGGAGAASAWAVGAARPPALSATARGDLRERARRAAAAPPPPAEPPAPPTACEVRALCTPPTATCALPAPPVGMAPHPSGRCVWVTLSSGEARCLSLPSLRPLRHLGSRTSGSGSHSPHYIQPSVSDTVFASPVPARDGAGGVRVWSAVSGGATPAARLPALSAPPVQALLLPDDDVLLVLAADTIHIWRSRARTSTTS